MTNRQGDWCECYSGIQFWPFDPRPDEVCLDDIAHSLSQMCRYGGHCSFFYSVAQHSLIVENEMQKAGYNSLIRFYGLMHDAAEAYMIDVPKPIKKQITMFSYWENNILEVIWEHYGVLKPNETHQFVIDLFDNSVLKAEADILMKQTHPWYFGHDILPLDCNITYVEMKEVESKFKAKAIELLNTITKGA